MRASLDWIFDGNPPLLKATYNHSILKRLYFIIESGDNGRTSIDAAASVLKRELTELWKYAGYGEILQDSSFIICKIRTLAEFLKNLDKTPHSRRSTPAFLKKESTFLATLPKLFDITVQSLRFSGKVTQEDRDFLLNHWWKPITSTPDVKLRNAFEKKLERERQSTSSTYSSRTTILPLHLNPPPHLILHLQLLPLIMNTNLHLRDNV